MARSVNQVFLIGNLTRDPELRQTPNGQNVCGFGLALNRAYRTQTGDWQEATDFIDIVTWGPLAERVSQYLAKGRRVLVQGRLQSRNWEQDGQKRTKVEVVANDVTFLDSRGFSGEQEPEVPLTTEKTSTEKLKPGKKDKEKEVVIEDISDEPINLDDIPF
ncbi:MAG: single-stranded DNA-binding protein [Candidatus Saccharimonadales bacterium]|jgi:single-strand DNA-binding protein